MDILHEGGGIRRICSARVAARLSHRRPSGKEPVSQPRPAEHESDPLLAFFEEAAAPQLVESTDPVPRVETQEKAQDPPPARASEADPESRRRLERAERQIDRTLIDITALKGDLATLVSAVDDIKKRMSRPSAKPEPVAAQPSRKAPWRRAVAAIVILLTAGAALWGLASVATYDVPEPPPVENETSSAVESPAATTPPRWDTRGVDPVVEPPPAPAPVVMPASARGSRPSPDYGGQAAEAGSATPSPPPARAAPARQSAPPVVHYVGTLTVDSEPAGDVYLNRKNVGRTPVRLENLRAGSHLIWIESEGYRRWTRVVAVVADRISRVSASLDPLSR